MREIPYFLREVNQFKHLRHIGGNLRIIAPRRLHGKSDILVGGFLRKKAKILKHRANAAA